MNAPSPNDAPADTPEKPAASSAASASAAEPRSPGISLREIVAYSSTFFSLLCLIKVYGVSLYSTTTTATLVATAPERVILGTLAIYVYPAMAALAYGISWLVVVWRKRIRPEAWPFLIAVVVITALMTPITYHLSGLALVAVSAVIEFVVRRATAARSLARRRIPHGLLTAIRGRVFLLVGALALALGFLDTLQSPWMSAEVFVLSEPVVTSTEQGDGAPAASRHTAVVSTKEPIVGYVVEESFVDYTVLDAETRYVMHLKVGSVVERYTCHEKQAQLRGQLPLLGWLERQHYASPNTNCDALVAQLRERGLAD